VRDPTDYVRANVDGTRNLLALARELGVTKAVYTSSVATMGFRERRHDRERILCFARRLIGNKRSKFLPSKGDCSGA